MSRDTMEKQLEALRKQMEDFNELIMLFLKDELNITPKQQLRMCDNVFITDFKTTNDFTQALDYIDELATGEGKGKICHVSNYPKIKRIAITY
jgi:hypothetical protein